MVFNILTQAHLMYGLPDDYPTGIKLCRIL